MREFIRNDYTREDWQALHAEGLNLPRLQHARWFNVVETAAGSGIPVAGVILLTFLQIHPALIVGAFFVLLILTGVLLDHISEGRCIPAEFQTVASLISYTSGSSKPDAQTVWTRDAVLATIFQLTSTRLCVPIGQITEHSHLIDDLGMD